MAVGIHNLPAIMGIVIGVKLPPMSTAYYPMLSYCHITKWGFNIWSPAILLINFIMTRELGVPRCKI